MDDAGFQYQVNVVITTVLKQGQTYLLSSGGVKNIVSFTNDSRNGSSRLFTTILKATPMRASVTSVTITSTLLNILADLKKLGAGDYEKTHADVKFEFVVDEGETPSPSSASSSS
jgi:hypothetical protein